MAVAREGLVRRRSDQARGFMMNAKWMLASLLTCWSIVSSASAITQYTIAMTEAVPTGVPGQFSWNTIPSAVSPTGLLAGQAGFHPEDAFINTRAVLWAPGGTQPITLPPPASSIGRVSGGNAVAINASGMMAGSLNFDSEQSGAGSHAIRWDSTGDTAVELGHLGVDTNGSVAASAHGINDAGVVVGQANKYTVNGASAGVRAVRWDANTTAATELATLGMSASGVTTASAYDVNNVGDGVGMAEKYSLSGEYLGARAVRWDSAGAIHELDIVWQHPTGFASSEARAINDSGVIVGFGRKYSGTNSQGTRAIRWDAATGNAVRLNALFEPPGGAVMTAEALAIDSTGNIVGSSMNGPFGEPYAVIWPAGETQPIALNALLIGGNGMTLTAATGINDAGQIVGYMRTGSPSQIRFAGFILTPVPEPTLPVLSFAALAVMLSRRRSVPVRHTTARTGFPGSMFHPIRAALLFPSTPDHAAAVVADG